LCCPAAAQEGGDAITLLRFEGGGPFDRVGEAVAMAGDIDGDGTPDLLVGADFASTQSFNRNGLVYVYSGATGAILWQFHGTADHQHFGVVVASAGDINLDGFDDILIGSPDASLSGLNKSGMIDIFSGQTGANLLHIDGASVAGYFGRSIANCGDINGDGIPDFIVGESGYNNEAGRVLVYSGLSGTTLQIIDGQAGDACGFSVSGAGDLDADGTPDFLVASPLATSGIFNENGAVTAYSGATWSPLLQLTGNEDQINFGNSVSGGFDVNDDGTPDFIVGAPFATNPGGFNSAGKAIVFSGTNGQVLHQVFGAAIGDNLGQSCALVGDTNGDRFGDFIVGASRFDAGGLADAGSALVFSGHDTSLLFRADGSAVQDIAGNSVSGGRDIDGDGLTEILYGAPWADPLGNNLAGLAEVKRLVPILASTASSISSSLGGLVDFTLNFPLSEASFGYILLASFSGLGPTSAFGVTIPLTNDPLIALMRAGGGAMFTNSIGTLDASGDGTAQLNLPSGAASGFIGTTFYFAAVSLSGTTSPRVPSNAITLLLEP
jgi:hypothetical protein